MDARFTLSEDQKVLTASIRQFVESEVKPYAAQWDADHQFPQEALDKCRELGLLGMLVPAALGGADMEFFDYILALTEVARGCASLSVILSVHNGLVTAALMGEGDETLQKKYVPRLASGEWLGCFALSEADAGSDPASMITTYSDDGDGYRLRGSKSFITNGPQADCAIVFATRDPSLGHKGLSAFVVEAGSSGYAVGKIENKMGICASGTSTLNFDNVHIPKKNLLGREGDGFRIAMRILDGGRIAVAAQALGIAMAAMDEAVQYAQEREQFGKQLTGFQGIRWTLSDMAVAIETSKLLIYKAARLRNAGQRCTLESAQAKLFASEAATRVCRKAVQIHGGYGYTRDYNVERHLRDARVTEIYEGTSQIQRLVIASQLAKDPTVLDRF